MGRQLLPPGAPFDDNDNENEKENKKTQNDKPQAREVVPLHFHASRASHDLPYATRVSKKRDRRDLKSTEEPSEPRSKKRELLRDVQSSEADDYESTFSIRRSHLDLNDSSKMIPPEGFMSQSTSEDNFFTAQTSDSVVYGGPPSSPPYEFYVDDAEDIDVSDQKTSSTNGTKQQNDSACFVGDTTVKLTSSITTVSMSACGDGNTSTRQGIPAGLLASFHENEQDKRANEVIKRAVDEGTTTIDLSSHDLERVPSQIQDLQFVSFSSASANPFKPEIQVFLQHNYLTSVPHPLFSVSNICVLSLRNNALKYISPAIGKLTNLKNLSLSQNELEFLPCEIMDLPLTVFSVHPNPFVESSSYKCTTTPGNNNNYRNILSHSQLHLTAASTGSKQRPVPSHSSVPALLEKCQLAIGHATHDQELRWKLDDHTLQVVNEGRHAYDNCFRCGVCKRRMVKGVGHCFEWRDGVCGQSGVVFKRPFCTMKCVDKWQKQQEGELN